MDRPTFSIIVPFHYEATKVEHFARGMTTLSCQTDKDFEVLIVHDGPFDCPNQQDKARYEYHAKKFGGIECMKKRYNDWGHSLRDYAMKKAKGEWIIHFNPDNVLYPYAITSFKQTIALYNKVYEEEPDMLIPPIYMMGCIRKGRTLERFRGKENEIKMLLQGFPPVPTNIDAMQLIARKSLWARIGYWKDKSEESDGIYAVKLYETCDGNVAYCDKPLGEHW